ncbi:hypothetical protein V8C86DRAFT_2589906 [Haematococcus lacustris]
MSLVTVVSLLGSVAIPTHDLKTVADLKKALHEEYADSSLRPPPPSKQRLLSSDGVVSDSAPLSLYQGHTLVLVEPVSSQPPQRPTPPQPIVTSQRIREAVEAEARARGREHLLEPERPGYTRNQAALTGQLPGLSDVEEPLRAFMQQLSRARLLTQQSAAATAALSSRLQAAAADSSESETGAMTDAAGASEARRSRVSDLAALDAAMQQLAAAFGVPMSQLVASRQAPGARHAGSDATLANVQRQMERLHLNRGAQPAQPQEIVAPEPPAHLLQELQAMGFSEPLVRKVRALALTRNVAESALDWLLMHGEDAEAQAPPTQEELRQVYGGPAGQQISSEMAVAQLMEMGFGRSASVAALRRFHNVELALAWLLSSSEGERVEGSDPQPPPQTHPAPLAPLAQEQQQQQQGPQQAPPQAPRARQQVVGSRGQQQQQQQQQLANEAEEVSRPLPQPLMHTLPSGAGATLLESSSAAGSHLLTTDSLFSEDDDDEMAFVEGQTLMRHGSASPAASSVHERHSLAIARDTYHSPRSSVTPRSSDGASSRHDLQNGSAAAAPAATEQMPGAGRSSAPAAPRQLGSAPPGLGPAGSGATRRQSFLEGALLAALGPPGGDSGSQSQRSAAF